MQHVRSLKVYVGLSRQDCLEEMQILILRQIDAGSKRTSCLTTLNACQSLLSRLASAVARSKQKQWQLTLASKG